MQNQNVIIERDAWFKEAETAEKSAMVGTAKALVSATMEIGVEEQDRRNTWINDADTFLARQCTECARTVFAELLSLFATSQTLWIKAAQIEKQYGTKETVDDVLARAVQAVPQSDTLWLMGAKEKWLTVRLSYFFSLV